MGKTFYLEITASDRKFYNGECEMMIFPAIDGQQGILPNHESMVTAVKAGELRFKVMVSGKKLPWAMDLLRSCRNSSFFWQTRWNGRMKLISGGQKKQKNGPRRGSDRRKARESTITARRRFPEQWQGLK